MPTRKTAGAALEAGQRNHAPASSDRAAPGTAEYRAALLQISQAKNIRERLQRDFVGEIALSGIHEWSPGWSPSQGTYPGEIEDEAFRRAVKEAGWTAARLDLIALAKASETVLPVLKRIDAILGGKEIDGDPLTKKLKSIGRIIKLAEIIVPLGVALASGSVVAGGLAYGLGKLATGSKAIAGARTIMEVGAEIAREMPAGGLRAKLAEGIRISLTKLDNAVRPVVRLWKRYKDLETSLTETEQKLNDVGRIVDMTASSFRELEEMLPQAWSRTEDPVMRRALTTLGEDLARVKDWSDRFKGSSLRHLAGTHKDSTFAIAKIYDVVTLGRLLRQRIAELDGGRRLGSTGRGIQDARDLLDILDPIRSQLGEMAAAMASARASALEARLETGPDGRKMVRVYQPNSSKAGSHPSAAMLNTYMSGADRVIRLGAVLDKVSACLPQAYRLKHLSGMPEMLATMETNLREMLLWARCTDQDRMVRHLTSGQRVDMLALMEAAGETLQNAVRGGDGDTPPQRAAVEGSPSTDRVQVQTTRDQARPAEDTLTDWSAIEQDASGAPALA